MSILLDCDEDELSLILDMKETLSICWMSKHQKYIKFLTQYPAHYKQSIGDDYSRNSRLGLLSLLW